METQQAEKEFNLLYEPWILVKNKQNETEEWSLLDVFKHAHEVQQLAGELPTQDMAIMRLLLAIMYGAFVTNDIEDAEDARNLWQELWELEQFPYDIIERYLKQHEERFWLFHPQYPFYQVADIEDIMNCYKAAKGKKTKNEEKLKAVARLIGELFQSDNLLRLFSGRNGDQQCVLNYSEAARWLLHLNGFDDDSAKNPTPKGVGYLGQIGFIYAQGENLFETLMLNFVLLDNNNQLFDDCRETSKAYWEKPICKTVENLISQPNAQKDLLTMQSRRILFKRDHRQVIGYLLTMGDYFDKEQGLFNEQMTLWKADEKIGFIPKRHMPEKKIWRNFSSLISTGGDNSTNRNSGVVHWLKELQDKEIISKNIVKFCIAGIYYKPKGAGWQIVDFVNDSLQVNSTILGMLGVSWVNEIIRVLSLTDKAVSALGWLAVDVAAAGGNSSKDHTELGRTARERGYHQLDGDFRKWLLSIHPQKDDVETKMAEWLAIAKKSILTQGEQILEQCSNKALVGRIKKDKDDKLGNVNCFEAFIKFKANVIHVLG
jgi:CRISPR system Cascade subunit CasA